MTPWTTARQASLSFTISRSLLRLMSVKLMMPSNHLILCRPFSSVQFSLSVVSDSATSWTAACQAFLSIPNSGILPKLMSIASVMPSSHLILCHPLLPPSLFPSIRVFSSKSVFLIRWPKYWSVSFSISPSN